MCHRETETQDFWGCPVMSGFEILTVDRLGRYTGGWGLHGSDVFLPTHRYSVTLGSGGFGDWINALGFFHIPCVIPGQFLWCGRVHFPTWGRASGSAVAIRLLVCNSICALSGIHINSRTQRFPSRTLHCNKVTDVIHFTYQCF